jgi:hypothetical protein
MSYSIIKKKSIVSFWAFQWSAQKHIGTYGRGSQGKQSIDGKTTLKYVLCHQQGQNRIIKTANEFFKNETWDMLATI